MKLWQVYFSVFLVAVHAEEEYYGEYTEVPPEYPVPVPADEPSPATAPPPTITIATATPPSTSTPTITPPTMTPATTTPPTMSPATAQPPTMSPATAPPPSTSAATAPPPTMSPATAQPPPTPTATAPPQTTSAATAPPPTASPATAPPPPTSLAPPPPNNLSCICTAEVNPVCGSDGVTYGNPCHLACAQKKNPDLKKAHDGECEHKCPPPASNKTAGCPCTKEFNPVCGSDGKTYGNVCVFCCAQRDKPGLTIASHGECVDECTNKESCICEDNYDPVCGSDGKTYKNTCELCCMKDAGVLKEHAGACDGSTCPNVQECRCSLNNDPVCGSDGKTYKNTCLLCCHKDSGVSKAHDGPCEEPTCPNVEECLCSLNFDPVCGSDGLTYNNTCLLCCHKGSGVTKVHDGPCVQNECPPPPPDNSCICPLFFLPICGTDGQTYGNMCLLCCEQRKDPDLTKEHDGPCGENYKEEESY